MVDSNATIQAGYIAKGTFTAVLASISWVLTYTCINEEVFAIFVVLILIDFITGVMKSWSNKIEITSKRMRWGIASKFSLILIPIVIGLGAKALGQNADALFTYGMNLLILSEVYSIIGNIYNIRTGKNLPEWDVIALFASRIRNDMEKRDDK